ncbi:MAG: hypothetical protein WCV92_00360 [Candidatus Buchananbacteria bacterium]
MSLNFEYNLKKDAENHRAIAHAKYIGKPSKVIEYFQVKFGGDFSDDKLKRFIKGLIDYNKIDIDQKVLDFKSTWQQVELEFELRMKNLFGDILSLDMFTAYITTNDRCTYSTRDNSFFLTVFSKQPRLVISHELFHLFTCQIFSKELNAMPQKAAYDTKESLTELLNFTCKDIIGAPDLGYDQHRELRKLICELWPKNNNLKKIFNKVANAAQSKHN